LIPKELNGSDDDKVEDEDEEDEDDLLESMMRSK